MERDLIYVIIMIPILVISTVPIAFSSSVQERDEYETRDEIEYVENALDPKYEDESVSKSIVDGDPDSVQLVDFSDDTGLGATVYDSNRFTGLEKMTYSGWLYVGNIDYDKTESVAGVYNTEDDQRSWRVSMRDEENSYGFHFSEDGEEYEYVDFTMGSDDDDFIHLAFTFEGEKEIIAYANGEEVEKIDLSDKEGDWETLYDTSEPLNFGICGDTNPFDGGISEQIIYEGALEEERIELLANGQLPIDEPIGHWTFRDGEGEEIKDISGGERHGELIDGDWDEREAEWLGMNTFDKYFDGGGYDKSIEILDRGADYAEIQNIDEHQFWRGVFTFRVSSHVDDSTFHIDIADSYEMWYYTDDYRFTISDSLDPYSFERIDKTWGEIQDDGLTIELDAYEEVFIASEFPYNYEHTVEQAHRHEDSEYVEVENIGTSGYAELDMYAKRIRDPEVEGDYTDVAVIARQHSGEVYGSQQIDGMIDYIMDMFEKDHIEPEEDYRFHIIPHANPDGIFYSQMREELTDGQDLNREWDAYDYEEIVNIRTYLEDIVNEDDFYFGFDLHTAYSDDVIEAILCQPEEIEDESYAEDLEETFISNSGIHSSPSGNYPERARGYFADELAGWGEGWGITTEKNRIDNDLNASYVREHGEEMMDVMIYTEEYEEPYFEVTIQEYEEEIIEGEELMVDYAVENTGQQQSSQDIEFTIYDDSDDEVFSDNVEDVELGEGEVFDDEFIWEAEYAGEYWFEVVTEDDEEEREFTVLEEVNFDVEIVHHDKEVSMGEEVTVNYTVTNIGVEGDTQVMRFIVSYGDEFAVTVHRDIELVTLGEGETHEGQFTWQTEEADPGEYDLNVFSEDDKDEVEVTVLEDPYFDVEIEDYDDEVDVGEKVVVEYAVSNMGVGEDTQKIEFTVDGEFEDSVEITLSEGDIYEDEFSWTAEETGEYDLKVASVDDHEEVTVTVIGESHFDVEIDEYDDEVYEGEEVTVNYTVTNTGVEQDTQVMRFIVSYGDEFAVTVHRDIELVTLGEGETHEGQFTWPTEEGDAGEYDLNVFSEDDEDSVEILVIENSQFLG